jgi:hypothetical protein
MGGGGLKKKRWVELVRFIEMEMLYYYEFLVRCSEEDAWWYVCAFYLLFCARVEREVFL